jgi:hypothetical protein
MSLFFFVEFFPGVDDLEVSALPLGSQNYLYTVSNKEKSIGKNYNKNNKKISFFLQNFVSFLFILFSVICDSSSKNTNFIKILQTSSTTSNPFKTLIKLSFFRSK